MDRLKVERIGGFGGFGLPGSKIKSAGEEAMSALSASDRASIDALFKAPALATRAASVPDGFRYRITRTLNGRDQTIEVPEAVVPPTIQGIVTDQLQ